MLNTITEDIRPSKDLRNNYAEISRECREKRTAIIFTVHGKADTVALGYTQYKELISRLELLEILDEGERDFRNGNYSSVEDVSDRVESVLRGAFQ